MFQQSNKHSSKLVGYNDWAKTEFKKKQPKSKTMKQVKSTLKNYKKVRLVQYIEKKNFNIS